MVEYERVGNLDQFDLDSVLEKEQRFREGLIAKKGPIAVIMIIILITILGTVFLLPMAQTIETANDELTEGWHKLILDLVPVFWILGIALFGALILLGINYAKQHFEGFEGGPSL